MIGDLSALRCCRLAEGEIVLHYHQMAAIVADRDAYGHCSKLRRVIDRFDSTKLGVAARARRRLYLDNLYHISLASPAYRRAARTTAGVYLAGTASHRRGAELPSQEPIECCQDWRACRADCSGKD